MYFPPIIERELLVARRKWKAQQTRWWTAAMAALLTCVCLMVSRTSQQAGHRLFEFLLLLGCYLALIQTPQITADLISQERRNNTLGLLFLAGLSPMEVFVSKLFAAALVALNNLLALIPYFSVPFLLGGVSFAQFAGAVCFLPNLLLFMLAFSLLASALCEDESGSLLSVAGFSAIIGFGLPLIYFGGQFFTGAPGISSDWLLLSPASGPYMVYRAFRFGSPAEFWLNAAITMAWSILALIAAGWALNRAWRDQAIGTQAAQDWRQRWRDWRRGTSAWREALRRRWLDDTPFVFAAACDRLPVILAGAAIASIGAVWLGGVAAWRAAWMNPAVSIMLGILINGAVVWIVAYAAGKRIGEDRKSGALELLLTTPLLPAEIVDGQRLALRAQFKPVLWGVFALNTIIAAAAWPARGWSWRALSVYLLAWLLVWAWTWIALQLVPLRTLWISLNTGRPAYAVLGGRVNVALLFMFWMFAAPGRIFSRFPSGSIFEFLLIGGFLVGTLFWMWWNNDADKKVAQIQEDFRVIARSPVPEPSDPRLKDWDRTRRFPLRKNDFDSVRRVY